MSRRILNEQDALDRQHSQKDPSWDIAKNLWNYYARGYGERVGIEHKYHVYTGIKCR